MGLMDRLFGRPAAKPATAAGPRSLQPGANGPASTRGAANSQQTVRKELVRVSVRDTLLHNGIPATWIRAEPLTTAQAGRDAGVHVRLVVQHWDSRLMLHSVSLQDHVEKRILALDPEAEQWLMGLSWQFALEDTSLCPPLPHPGSWTSAPPEAVAAATAPAPVAAAPLGQGDVISGPTRIEKSGEDKRAELERLLGERDADFSGDDGGFSKTQPMGFEKTQPMTALDPASFERTQPVQRQPQFDKTQPVKRPPG
ncbi:hypothetical protein [Ramlibacter humi]|uniref:Uncharacterized protein n=1 Tax=Ramlibacter humi TaxID=2530451 RepID=A0A4Z0CB82_9BURK|nr:hypothetical protein [Ramlibacter humi]TFZ08916.1 hypothetical protein EZ216_07170 [Ramlibacter humi]